MLKSNVTLMILTICLQVECTENFEAPLKCICDNNNLRIRDILQSLCI